MSLRNFPSGHSFCKCLVIGDISPIVTHTSPWVTGIRVYGIGEILMVTGYQRWAKELMHLGNGSLVKCDWVTRSSGHGQ
jgi:hypothetical protein